MKNFISRTLKAVGIAGTLGGILFAAAPAKADVAVETPRGQLVMEHPIVPVRWDRWHGPEYRWHGPAYRHEPRGWERGGWEHRGWRR